MNLMAALAEAVVVVLLAGAGAIIVFLVAAQRNEVPAVFTPTRAMAEVIDALDLPKQGQLCDLGCGDGRVLAAAIGRQPKLKAVGVDNNPVLLALARLRLRNRAQLDGQDILAFDLNAADRVFAYLGPGLMADLEPKFDRELRSGSRVVSQQFPLPNRKPDQVIDLARGKPYAKKLYVYQY